MPKKDCDNFLVQQFPQAQKYYHPSKRKLKNRFFADTSIITPRFPAIDFYYPVKNNIGMARNSLQVFSTRGTAIISAFIAIAGIAPPMNSATGIKSMDSLKGHSHTVDRVC